MEKIKKLQFDTVTLIYDKAYAMWGATLGNNYQAA